MEEDKEKNQPFWKGINTKTLYRIAVVVGILVIVNLLFYETVKKQRKEARVREQLELREKRFREKLKADSAHFMFRRKPRKVFGDGVDSSLFQVK